MTSVGNPYIWGTTSHFNHALKEYGIPEQVVYRLQVVVDNIELPEEDRELKMFDNVNGKKLLGRAKYFRGIEQPLFCFIDPVLIKSWVKVSEDGSKKLELYLSLKCGNVTVTLSGDNLTDSLFEFIERIFDNRCTNHGEVYNLREESKAIMDSNTQYGEHERFIELTFFEPSKAQTFVDYINNNYKFD